MSSVRQSFNRASNSYNSVSIVQKQMANKIINILKPLALCKQTILDLGAGTGLTTQLLQQQFPSSQILTADISNTSLQINQQSHPGTQAVCADAQHLPFSNQSINLITSNAMLQWCPNLNNVFLECRRILKDKGLFVFTSFDTGTLTELKQSWAAINNEKHVNDFVSPPIIHQLLQLNGFTNISIQTQTITLKYQNVMDIIYSLKQLGANHIPSSKRGLIKKNTFNKMLQHYELFRQDDGKLPVTYEVIFGYAWR